MFSVSYVKIIDRDTGGGVGYKKQTAKIGRAHV